MQIYLDKLQKRINISPYYSFIHLDVIPRNSIRLKSIRIKINMEKKVDKYLAR